jgi:hypothetical protein
MVIKLFHTLLVSAAMLALIQMATQRGFERGYDLGVQYGREECEIATEYPFETILPNRIEPLCWKILREKYDNKPINY